jgi:hypothetical protein
MNNAFGHIPEDLLQQAQEAWDFKTCQRSDGTTYGTSGDCTQLGSKEVSKSSSKKKASKKSSWDDSNLAGKMGTEIAKVASNADILNAIRAENAAKPGVASKGFENARASVSREAYDGVFDTYNRAVGIKDQAGVAYDRGDWASAVAKFKQAYATNDKAIAIFENAKAKFDNDTKNFKSMAGVAEKAYVMRGRIARDTDNAAKYGNMAKPNLPQSRSGKPNSSSRRSSGGGGGGGGTASLADIQGAMKSAFNNVMGDVISWDQLGNHAKSTSQHRDGTWKTRDGRSWTDYDAMFRHINRSGTTMWQPGMNPGYN